MSGFVKGLGKKVGLGRFGAPAWAVALAMAATAAVAGQALGPVLAGGGSGDVGVVASQNLFFSAADATSNHAGADGIDQAAGSIDTAGLIVTGAFRMHRGDDASTLEIDVTNRGEGTRSANLKVIRPAGSSVNLSESDSACNLAQRSVQVVQGVQTDDYLLVVNGSGVCDITASVQVGGAEPLGSYEIDVTLQEIP